MTDAPRRKWTVEEYLEFERNSETRHEFLDGEVFPLGQPPARIGSDAENHDLIGANAVKALRSQLNDCRVYERLVNVQPAGVDFDSDITVMCGQPLLEDNVKNTLLNPVVIIEILSPSTERDDRGLKFQHYRTIDSLQEYVLISQDAPRVECFARTDDDRWLLTDAVGLDATLELPSIGCTLRLADVYEQVRFGDEDDQSAP